MTSVCGLALRSLVGFVDMVDIVSFIVAIYDETEILGENFFTTMEQGERFVKATVAQITSNVPSFLHTINCI